jgi:hypothetical protein
LKFLATPALSFADKRVGLAAAAWIAIVGVAVLGGLQFLIYPWIHERVTRAGEAGVQPAVWLAIDYLFLVWLFTPELLCLFLALAAWATWRIRRDRLVTSTAMRRVLLGGTAISLFGAAALAVLVLPSAFVLLTRPAICETHIFDEAVSPNGRYAAIVAEVDCGAMSGLHRQVVLTRRPFGWASTSILYFNDDPSLRLSWSGRTLSINGDRTLASMKRRPPDPMIWGGVLARYSGPKEYGVGAGRSAPSP